MVENTNHNLNYVIGCNMILAALILLVGFAGQLGAGDNLIFSYQPTREWAVDSIYESPSGALKIQVKQAGHANQQSNSFRQQLIQSQAVAAVKSQNYTR